MITVRRFDDIHKVQVSPKAIYNARWSNTFTLNGVQRTYPYYIITAQIDYLTAIELNIASGLHDNLTGHESANIRILKCDNEKNDDYAELCKKLGPKPTYK